MECPQVVTASKMASIPDAWSAMCECRRRAYSAYYRLIFADDAIA